MFCSLEAVQSISLHLSPLVLLNMWMVHYLISVDVFRQFVTWLQSIYQDVSQ